MKHIATSAMAGLALSMAAPICCAQTTTLSGPYAAGSYTFQDEDVIINGVTVTGSGPTFSVHVYNGSLTVLGLKADGENGSAGDLIGQQNQADGGHGADGYNVYLRTRGFGLTIPGQPAPVYRPRTISITGTIDTTGGNGGDGGYGRDARVAPSSCQILAAEHGHAAGDGGDGGNVTIISFDSVHVSGPIRADGGHAGHGGSGGDGRSLSAGSGAEGGRGGDGGNISINATGHIDISRGMTADGGDGDYGGNGAYGDYDGSPGGAGGAGGDGGNITFNGDSMEASAGANGLEVSTRGGDGRAGGLGGSGGGDSCIDWVCNSPDHDCFEDESHAGNGGSGSVGGDGGNGGAITFTVDQLFEASSRARFTTAGGEGGLSGRPGLGELSDGLFCTPSPFDLCGEEEYAPDCEYPVLLPGQSVRGGYGGVGGDITITADAIVLDSDSGGYATYLESTGGDGGEGNNAPATHYECCEFDINSANGTQGSPGAVGGAGGHVSLHYTAGLALPAGYGHFATCGGLGSDGFMGGAGHPAPGSGGAAGQAGANGSVYVNTNPLLPVCPTPTYSSGPVGELHTCGGTGN